MPAKSKRQSTSHPTSIPPRPCSRSLALVSRARQLRRPRLFSLEEPMTKLEMVRQAVRELGEVPYAELSAFVRRQHATDIPPPIVAVILATLRDRELLER